MIENDIVYRPATSSDMVGFVIFLVVIFGVLIFFLRDHLLGIIGCSLISGIFSFFKGWMTTPQGGTFSTHFSFEIPLQGVILYLMINVMLKVIYKYRQQQENQDLKTDHKKI
ncbi:MAG: hypothetical protein NUV91_05155 [Candidatus Omnitrophica bacterium]|nr:hypothetical protein [Candidatus Omnitrophota bacterium]